MGGGGEELYETRFQTVGYGCHRLMKRSEYSHLLSLSLLKIYYNSFPTLVLDGDYFC